jgi:predicted dehydrogenase
MMTKVRWGILGVANIATEKVLPAMQQGKHCEVIAIASRTKAKAEAAAMRLGIARAYGSYDGLLADRDVDAVYIPLPNHLHVPWSIKALAAGKHVLCEKPIALSVAEAETLVETGRRHPRLKLMEAFMYRFHPQWQTAKRLADEGRIGTVRTITTIFSYFNRDAENVRNQADIGGGGLMDIGCYAISLSRFLFNAEPRRVLGIVEFDPDFRTDRLTSGILDFAAGTSTFTVSTQLVPYQRVQILGTEGRVEIEIPFNAPADQPCTLWHATSRGVEEMLMPICNQYALQADLFSRAILDDTPPPTPIDDAVNNMRVIEALFRSGQSGAWERPGIRGQESGDRSQESTSGPDS